MIVTGASSGIGKAAAQLFVRLNAKKTILACRSIEKGEVTKAEIEEAECKSPGVIEVWQLDMTTYAGIKDFCRRAGELERLDVFVANAGMVSFDCQLYEGYERQTFLHIIAPFLMAVLLLPIMRRTLTRFQSLPHYVMVGSNGHMGSKFTIGPADSLLEAVKGDRDMRNRYFDSKLLQVLASRELARRIKASDKPLIVLNTVDPGFCATDLLREKSWELPVRMVMNLASIVLARSPDLGARTYIMAASAGPESHGLYLEDCDLSTPSSFVETEEGKRFQAKIYDELAHIVEQVEPGVCGNI